LAHATHVYVRTVRGSPHVEKFCQNSTTAVWAIAIFYFEKKKQKKNGCIWPNYNKCIQNAYIKRFCICRSAYSLFKVSLWPTVWKPMSQDHQKPRPNIVREH